MAAGLAVASGIAATSGVADAAPVGHGKPGGRGKPVRSTLDPFGSGTQTARAGNGTVCTVGEVILTAGQVANGVPAKGQLISIAANYQLYGLLGNTFGGSVADGNFGLPDLAAAAPDNMTYSICTQGTFPHVVQAATLRRHPKKPKPPRATGSPFGNDTQTAMPGSGRACSPGEIILNAGAVANGLPASGQMVSADTYPDLYDAIGNRFGGNGTTFALPNLASAAPNGLTYSICTEGTLPEPDAPGDVAANRHRHHKGGLGATNSPFGSNTQTAVAGKVVGGYCTEGVASLWAGGVVFGTPANGQVQSLDTNTELWALIGNTYGGTYPSTFALPNMKLTAPNDMTYAICADDGVFPASD